MKKPWVPCEKSFLIDTNFNDPLVDSGEDMTKHFWRNIGRKSMKKN